MFEKISVVLPLYNAEKYVIEALDSIQAQQGDFNFEVILVHGPSTDQTKTITRAHHPAYIHLNETRLADGIARNTGVRAASGEYLTLLDGDDYWSVDKTLKQMAVLQANPSLDAVFGHAQEFYEPVELNQPRRMGDVIPAHVPGSILIKREAFLRIGYYDERYQIGSVADWFMRAQEQKLNFVTIPDVVLYRRIHENNLGRRKKSRQNEYLHIIKGALDRRRAEQDREKRK